MLIVGHFVKDSRVTRTELHTPVTEQQLPAVGGGGYEEWSETGTVREEATNMSHKVLWALTAGIAMWIAAPASADYYDDFGDGQYARDPNIWDIDRPSWMMDEKIGDLFLEDANSGELRMFADTIWFPYCFVGARVDTGDHDPNTSTCYWDDTTSHYILAKVRNNGWEIDPNTDHGIVSLMMHGDFDMWQTFWLCYEYSDDRAWNGGWLAMQALDGTDTKQLKGTTIRGWQPPAGDPNYSDPNLMWADPNYMDEHNGFWMCLQFEITNPSYPPGDPNGKRLRAACWNGDKYAWNGTWTLDADLGNPASFKTQPWTDWWPDRYWTHGVPALASYSDGSCGFPADSTFDNIEARTGVFTNVARSLRLTVAHDNWGTITIDPDIRHPSDPNLPAEKLLRYTDGTQVVLSATAITKKAFDKWVIWDPNYPNDPNRAITDSNAVLHLTMDRDYDIQASFKCASGLEPMLGIGLAVLVLGVIIRRIA
jgi:hypothetical protein